ncbi:acetolactate decarboxylase [Flavobacterium sp. IMCC34518]|uniref:acetolactate decarboxylase n=1 Tax=Flavobacterium sp. IMCC34518 TaxID=3003623 RepID=UPI0022AC855F|nr:acetolactate decarboxylase [Flavobacterium sp. IMCC34518]
MTHSLKTITFLLIVLSFFTSSAQKDKNTTIYQYATINALMEGGFDGDMTLAALQKKGSFGIGTFNELDGEMIGFDNHFYQIKSDGKAYAVDPSQKTPFAVVTNFSKENVVFAHQSFDLKKLYALLDTISPNRNLYVAYKMKVKCQTIKTRSVSKQIKPYPLMIDAVKKQSVFELGTISGTLIGFRFPEYMKGLNVPGYHFHFLSDDKKVGGHVLDLLGSNFEIEIDYMDDFEMHIPNNEAFNKLNLTKTKVEDLEKVEK